MAVTKFYNAYCAIDGTGGPPLTGGTQLPHVHSVTLNWSADMLDVSEMSVTTKKNLAGLEEWSVEVEMLQDYAASSVDEILEAKMGTAAFNIQVRPDAGAVAAANPEYYGSCVLETYNPIDGGVGEAQMVRATFRCAGDLTRTTG